MYIEEIRDEDIADIPGSLEMGGLLNQYKVLTLPGKMLDYVQKNEARNACQ